MEVWKVITGYEDYEVSSIGRVRSNKGKNPRILLHSQTGGRKNNRYDSVFLCSGSLRKRLYVHRLVALEFIDNPDGKKEVDHINRNKRDNSVDNLRWVTRRENVNYFKLSN
jgi:hypothetical protein